MERMTTADLQTLKSNLQRVEPGGMAEGYAIGRLVYRIDAEIMKRELPNNVVKLRAL